MFSHVFVGVSDFDRALAFYRALIQQVLNASKEHGTTRVYWNTYEDNATARLLYDKMAKYLGSIVYTHEL